MKKTFNTLSIFNETDKNYKKQEETRNRNCFLIIENSKIQRTDKIEDLLNKIK